jgi:thiol:disulfide interchange protein
MWIAVVKSAIGLVTVTVGMWLLAKLVQPMVTIATSGPNASAASVQRVGGYFNALTVDNLVLVGAVAVGLAFLARAAVEARLG